MPSLTPITPSNTIAITVAAASAAVPIPTPVGENLVVTSPAANAVAFIAFGSSSLTVVIPTGTKANGFPILPGTVQTFSVPTSATHMATIGTVANTLYVSCGDGF